MELNGTPGQHFKKKKFFIITDKERGKRGGRQKVSVIGKT
jgi:hypothetical protein